MITLKIIVTAGGTGGHIYPALAIINKFLEHDKNTEVLYIGTHNRMEKDIVPKSNIFGCTRIRCRFGRIDVF